MSVVDDIKARLDIVDVVSDYVTLRKAGRYHKAVCPFHTEKTPSFIVDPERQSWRCFGACATGGDAFSFVMRHERIDFGEALKRLAEKTGVPLRPRREDDRNDILYSINQEAVKYYQEVLASSEGKQAIDYLAERGVGTDARSAFQLGLSPRGRDRLKSHLVSLGFEVEQAVAAGVLRRSDDGRVRDFFWARLMFPIHDRQGRVVGFGARSLDESGPKYINTAATSIFDKRAILYGLHKAIDSIRQQDTAVIVEGYTDAIAAHEHGYTNVVASMGTALTEQQVASLRSSVRTFVQALDPDAAGQAATLRSLESTYLALDPQPLGQRQLIDLRIATLPPGRDPDDLIRRDSTEWDRVVREAVDFKEFVISAMASRHDLSTTEGKTQAAEALRPFIMSIRDPFAQDRYFQKLADTLSVPRDLLEASIGKPRFRGYRRAERRHSRQRPETVSTSALAGASRDPLEEYILALLLSVPELRQYAQDLAPAQFHRTENREVFACWQSSNTIDELRICLDMTLHEHLSYLNQLDLPQIDQRSAKAALSQALLRLEIRHLQELQEGLLVTENASIPPPRGLEPSIVGIDKRLKELHSLRK